MENVKYKDLLDAGVHFGHLTRKWNPKMAPYIFMERNGIHIIDLNKTIQCLEDATKAIRQIVRSGRKVMFVATKKQAKEVVSQHAQNLNMPYVTERWLGGMLTNFSTIRKSLKKMTSIEKMMKEETYKNLAKRERLMITREKEKLHRILGGISELTRLPAALFVVDVKNEHIAIKEAQKLNIPVFAMVDTNSDPGSVDFPVPSNDDAFKSITIITDAISKAVEEGLMERKQDKEESKRREEEAAKIKADQEGDHAEAGKEVEAAKKETAETTKKETETTE
jgi:small subunit ribosomal protein S2